MTPLSRAARHALPLLLFLTAAVALGGCGRDAPSANLALHTPSTPAPMTTSSTPTPTDEPTQDASATATGPSSGSQLVKVTKFGIAFELPRAWITLDAKKVLASGGKNPILDELARRMGTTPEQLAKTFSAAVQTFSVSGDGAHHGFLDNVNTVGQEGDVNDETLKFQLATVGAKPSSIEHATSAAGDVTRVTYDVPTKIGLTVHAVAVVVHADGATVVVTISSSATAAAARIADQVQRTLQPIPGRDPGA